MATFKLAFVFVIVCAALQTSMCDSHNETTESQTAGDGTTYEKTSLEKGVEPVYNLYHGFLKTVMKENFYKADSAAFSYQKLEQIVKNGNYEQLREDWQDITKTFGGFAACIIVGLLFLFVMPIIGWFFCCCYCCCNKCGNTKEHQDPKAAKCKRVTYVSFLLIFTTLMLVGAIVSMLGAELLHRSLKNEDHKGLVGRLENHLNDVRTFSRDSINNVKTHIKEEIIDDAMSTIFTKVNTAVNETVTDVKELVNADFVLNQARQLGDEAMKALDDVRILNSSLKNLQNLQDNITDELNNLKTAINASCPAPCNIDTDNMIFNPDYKRLDDLQREAANLLQAQNITTFADDRQQEFDRIIANVDSEVANALAESKKEIRKVNDTLEEKLNEFDAGDKIADSLEDAQTTLANVDNDIKEYEKYAWYTFIGLGCAVLLPVLFYYLGVLFGLCGERPKPGAPCCNKGTGSNFLVAGICCSFLFAYILMMVVILLFALGGTSYIMACQYLQDGIEKIDTFEPVFDSLIGSNPVQENFNVTIGQVLQNCKNNEALYTALNVKNIFNLDDLLNVSDIQREVDKMANTNLNISNITLLTTDLQREINKYNTSGLATVNFTEYHIQITTQTFGVELSTLKNNLSSANLTDLAHQLQMLQDNQGSEIDTEKKKLQNAVEDLEGIKTDLIVKVDALIASIRQSQDDFNRQKDTIVQERLTETVRNVSSYIATKAKDLKYDVENNLVKCGPVYAAAQGVSDAVCTVTLDPLNCIWFGLGWSLFFYIPCFIFAVLLSSLYKRTEPYRKKQRGFEDGHSGGYDGYNQGDNIPLTSRNVRDQLNGKFNAAFDSPANQGRAHRNEPQYESPGHHGYGGASGSAGYHGDKRHNGGYEAPPHYDDVTRGDNYHGRGGYRSPNY